MIPTTVYVVEWTTRHEGRPDTSWRKPYMTKAGAERAMKGYGTSTCTAEIHEYIYNWED